MGPSGSARRLVLGHTFDATGGIDMDTRTTPGRVEQNGLVWLDREHALVARAYPTGTLVTEVDREWDPQPAFFVRVARELADCDRLVVMGTDAARVEFERAFVALYRRPDRLIDAGTEPEPEPRELADQLRVLAPATA
jgi:hypothetical protein